MKKHKWYYSTGKKMNVPSNSAFFNPDDSTQQQDSGSQTTSTSQGNQNVVSPVLNPVALGLPKQTNPLLQVGNNSTLPVTEPTDNTSLYLIVGALAILYFLKGN